MKKYMLFQGVTYYPGGGWEDFKGAFATLDEAVAEGARLCTGVYGPWFHVATLADGLVFEGNIS